MCQPLSQPASCPTFATWMLHGRKPAVNCWREGSSVMIFSRLRIELADHPGALAAVTRVLAAGGLNVVEVSIHEVEAPRAVDEIVVHAEAPIEVADLTASLQSVGAQLLSVGPCDIWGD